MLPASHTSHLRSKSGCDAVGLAKAFSSRDHRAGRRAKRQLDRVTAQLEDLYAKWTALG
jgi:hypothetical protein|tara:strand:+ start:139 stop:315 length:177 start_codon:yes stop_codon:yes gene_type:complete